MNTRHEFADILIAIAEGKEVEFRAWSGDWTKFKEKFHGWPGVYSNVEWRVKPQVIKKKVWVNVYPQQPNSSNFGFIYSRKKIADDCAGMTRIACVETEIEYHEGQGLENSD